MRAGTPTPTGDGAQGWEQNTGQGWSRANFDQGGESAADLNRQQQARSTGAAREASFQRSGSGFSAGGEGGPGAERGPGAEAAGAERGISHGGPRSNGARAGRGGGTAAPALADAWFVSAGADFWVASAGGASLLIVMALVLLWHGDRELHAADLLLSELHLGATYDAIVRRRLWRRMPLAIVVATYASCGTAGGSS